MAILRQVTLKQSGKGQITLNDHELPSGDYAYSLFVNGKTVDITLMLITLKY